jgi:hypothetical protein
MDHVGSNKLMYRPLPHFISFQSQAGDRQPPLTTPFSFVIVTSDGLSLAAFVVVSSRWFVCLSTLFLQKDRARRALANDRFCLSARPDCWDDVEWCWLLAMDASIDVYRYLRRGSRVPVCSTLRTRTLSSLWYHTAPVGT